MISPPASPDRRDAELPGSGFGRILAAFAPGLVPCALMVIALVAVSLMAGTGPGRAPSPVSSLRPAVVGVSASAPRASQMLKLEREGTAIAADVELVSDPAMPGPASVAATPRRFGLADFREAQAPSPPRASPAFPLRPPRAA